MIEPLVVAIARDALAAVLIMAGAAKLSDLSAFEATLVGLVGKRYGALRWFAMAVAAWEVGLGMAVLGVSRLELVNVGLVVTFGGFVLATSWAVWRRPGLSCRCFGALSNSEFSVRRLITGTILTLIAILVLIADHATGTQPSIDPSMLAFVMAGYALLGLATIQAARTVEQVREMVQT